MSARRKRGAADFMIFALIAIAVVFFLFVASWLGTYLGYARQAVVKGTVDFYTNVDDKGTEFAFLEMQKRDFTYMEILGMVGSGMKAEGEMKSYMLDVERSIGIMSATGGNDYYMTAANPAGSGVGAATAKAGGSTNVNNFYIAVIDWNGNVVYEKKTGEPPLVLEAGAEDLSFKWPLDPKDEAITSGFGWRKDPINNLDAFHGGADIAGSTGDNVYSATDGVVVSARFTSDQDFGNLVVVKYVSAKTRIVYYIYYGHLSSYSVKAGDSLKAGDVLGKVGSTGKSTNPHLHFEVRRDRNGDGAFASGEDAVNFCPYMAGAKGGAVDLKKCMKKCPVYDNPSACDIDVAVVKNSFDIPLLGGNRGSVELVIW
jgi:murein DD-endopeptidase MepM/ murein hydrolase activator NlpD